MSDTGQDTPSGVEQEPTAGSDQDRELAERLVAETNDKGLDLVGPDGVLTGLTKRVLEAGLEAELTEHLGYDKHTVEGRDGGNSRNGTRPKTVLTKVGPVKLDVPRDRDSSFEPQLVSPVIRIGADARLFIDKGPHTRPTPKLSKKPEPGHYDANTVRAELAARHIDDAVIAHRRRLGEPKIPGKRPLLLGLRWTVERTNSWLSNHGQLRRNTDRSNANRLAQLALAITLIITAKLIDWHDRWNRP